MSAFFGGGNGRKSCLRGQIEVLLVALALEIVNQWNNAESVLRKVRIELCNL